MASSAILGEKRYRRLQQTMPDIALFPRTSLPDRRLHRESIAKKGKKKKNRNLPKKEHRNANPEDHPLQISKLRAVRPGKKLSKSWSREREREILFKSNRITTEENPKKQRCLPLLSAPKNPPLLSSSSFLLLLLLLCCCEMEHWNIP